MPSLSRRNIFSLLAAPLLPRVKGTVNDTVVAGSLPEIWHDPDDLQLVRYLQPGQYQIAASTGIDIRYEDLLFDDDLQSVPYAEYRTAQLQQIANGIGISPEDLLRDLSCCSYTSR